MVGCGAMRNHIEYEITPPSKAWIKVFAKSLDFDVVNSQTLEHIHRTSCDIDSILGFFSEHHLLMDRHPALIMNMDETMLSGKRRYKVVSLSHNLPLQDNPQAFPHITGVVTITALGKLFEPFLILPNKKTKRGIEHHLIDTTITSSSSGWMNKRIFMLYCIDIVAQIQLYRLTLPEDLRNENFLLIVDGHSSRMNFYALYFLYLFGIDLLVLPPHSSHIVQPFDIGIAGPLKAKFVKRISVAHLNVDLDKCSANQVLKLTAQETRDVMIDAFISGLKKVCSDKSTVRNSFAKAGIYPLDQSAPITSDYICPKAVSPKKI